MTGAPVVLPAPRAWVATAGRCTPTWPCAVSSPAARSPATSTLSSAVPTCSAAGPSSSSNRAPAAHQFGPGDYVLFPVGMPHAWRNESDEQARWVELSTPQPLLIGVREEDTLLRPAVVRTSRRGDEVSTSPIPAWGSSATTSAPRRRRRRSPSTVRRGATRRPAWTPRYWPTAGSRSRCSLTPGWVQNCSQCSSSTMSQAVPPRSTTIPSRKRIFSSKVRSKPRSRGRQQPSGRRVLVLRRRLRHGFFNTSYGRVRWIETQAPQPPRRHSYRWPAHWERLHDKYATTTKRPPEKALTADESVARVWRIHTHS